MFELLLVGLISYCGLFAGILLCKFAQDEIKTGDIHFKFVYSLSVFAYLAALMFYNTSYLAFVIVILCAIVFYLRKNYYQMLYATFPFALLYTSNVLLLSIVFFIVGLLITSQEMTLFAEKKTLRLRKQAKKILIHLLAKTFYFFPAAIILISQTILS